MINFGILLCQHAQNLEELIMDIKSFPCLTKEGLEEFMENIIHNLPFLKRYTLNFLQAIEHQKESQTKIKPLKKLVSQSPLELNLHSYKLNLWSFQFYGKLRILTLSFIDKRMSNTDLVNLFHNIFQLSLQDLEKFTLICRKAIKISDKAFIPLRSYDWTRLTNLKSFTLEFPNSNCITDQALK